MDDGVEYSGKERFLTGISMTPRERLLAPFRGIKPDRPAWLADLTYWYRTMEARDRLEPRYQGEEGCKRLHEDLGVCCYYHRSTPTYTTQYDGVDARVEEKEGVRTRWWRTPAGELTDRWHYIEEGNCWGRVEYAAKTAEDLKVVQDLFARTRHGPDETSFSQAAAFLGDSGLPISAVPRSPLPALLADWCGVMNTIYLVYDEPSAVQDTLQIIDRANEDAFECAVASPVELFHFCDNLDSGNCASLFEVYMEEYYRRRLRQLHDAGRYAVVHLDGMVRGLLPRLAGAGFDGIESVTPGPVGDVEIEDLREVAANERTILWGGIPGAMFCDPWTEDEVREQTRRVFAALWEDGRLVVGSADQIPPNGHIDYCRVVADAIEAFS